MPEQEQEEQRKRFQSLGMDWDTDLTVRGFAMQVSENQVIRMRKSTKGNIYMQ